MATRPVLIVGVDGTPASRHALAAAADLAANDLAADLAHFDCELLLAGHDIAWTFQARHGDAATELQRAADDHDAAFIVVGQHRHRLVTRMLMRSVTDRLVHHAHRPVLVVPTPP